MEGNVENTENIEKVAEVLDSQEQAAELPKDLNTVSEEIIVEEENYEEEEIEEEEDDDDDDDDDDEEDQQYDGESATAYFLRMQAKKNQQSRERFNNQSQSNFEGSSSSEQRTEQSSRPFEPEPEQPKKKYEGEDSWKNLDDKDYYQENAIKLTQLIDTANTEVLRKLIQMFLVEGKQIKEIKLVIDTYRKRSANREFVYLEQEEYIKCLEAYVKLYEEDIPMPNSLKRALAIYLRDVLKKWLDKNSDSPLVGLAVAFSTYVGNLGIKVVSIRSGLVEPEIVDEGGDVDEDEADNVRVVNIDHVQ